MVAPLVPGCWGLESTDNAPRADGSALIGPFAKVAKWYTHGDRQRTMVGLGGLACDVAQSKTLEIETMIRSLKRLSLATLAFALALPIVAQAGTGMIGMEHARTIALGVAHGPVVKSELEKEDGAMRYSFDIKEGTRIHEIGVDAYTGKIVENAYEAPGSKD